MDGSNRERCSYLNKDLPFFLQCIYIIVEKMKEAWKCSKCNIITHINMVMCDKCEVWFHW